MYIRRIVVSNMLTGDPIHIQIHWLTCVVADKERKGCCSIGSHLFWKQIGGWNVLDRWLFFYFTYLYFSIYHVEPIFVTILTHQHMEQNWQRYEGFCVLPKVKTQLGNLLCQTWPVIMQGRPPQTPLPLCGASWHVTCCTQLSLKQNCQGRVVHMAATWCPHSFPCGFPCGLPCETHANKLTTVHYVLDCERISNIHYRMCCRPTYESRYLSRNNLKWSLTILG